MAENPNAELERLANREYQYGFVTDIEADTFPLVLVPRPRSLGFDAFEAGGVARGEGPRHIEARRDGSSIDLTARLTHGRAPQVVSELAMASYRQRHVPRVSSVAVAARIGAGWTSADSSSRVEAGVRRAHVSHGRVQGSVTIAGRRVRGEARLRSFSESSAVMDEATTTRTEVLDHLARNTIAAHPSIDAVYYRHGDSLRRVVRGEFEAQEEHVGRNDFLGDGQTQFIAPFSGAGASGGGDAGVFRALAALCPGTPRYAIAHVRGSGPERASTDAARIVSESNREMPGALRPGVSLRDPAQARRPGGRFELREGAQRLFARVEQLEADSGILHLSGRGQALEARAVEHFAAVNPDLRQVVTSSGWGLRLHRLREGAWNAVDVPVRRLRDGRVGRRFAPPEGLSAPVVESLARALVLRHGEAAVIVAGDQSWRAADLRIRDAPSPESRSRGF